MRKAKTSNGLVRIIADEIDTIVNEHGKREPSKILSSHFIHVCDCSMPDLGKELTHEDTSGTRLQEAPKVVVSVGDHKMRCISKHLIRARENHIAWIQFVVALKISYNRNATIKRQIALRLHCF